MTGVQCDNIHSVGCYVFTVKDSPHPQASVTLGFDVILLYHFIKLCRTVYIFKVIGQASTALVADSYADELRRRTAHQDLQTLHGLGGLHIEQKKG